MRRRVLTLRVRLNHTPVVCSSCAKPKAEAAKLMYTQIQKHKHISVNALADDLDISSRSLVRRRRGAQ